MLLHRARFQRGYVDAKLNLCVGAMVLHTNGLYFYHDGQHWTPMKGLTATHFIKLFQVAPPILDDDEFGIVMGLTDDNGVLMHAWDESSVRRALNEFLTQFPEDYKIWPDGEVLNPLAKSRMLTAKRRRTAVDALTKNMVDAKDAGHIYGTRCRRRSLMAKSVKQ